MYRYERLIPVDIREGYDLRGLSKVCESVSVYEPQDNSFYVGPPLRTCACM